VAFASRLGQWHGCGRGRSSRRREPKLVLVRSRDPHDCAGQHRQSRRNAGRRQLGAAISRDGRFVAFVSEATNLAGRRNREADVFLRDVRTGRRPS
jgi:hypothetical protein